MQYRDYGSQRVTSVKARVLANVRSEDRGYIVAGQPSRCLIWTGTDRDKGGYGRVKRAGRYIPVHWVLAGDPPAGMEKDHLCHQRDCIRPLHLQDATKSVNTANRQATKSVRLTEAQKERIRVLLANGVPRASIVKSTGISRRTVNRLALEGEQE